MTSSFTCVPNYCSAPMAKASCVEQQFPPTRIPTAAFAPSTSYKWQVREKNTYGSVSNWVQFNSGGTAFTISAGLPANRLAFVNGPLTVVAGACSALVTVQNRNSSGTPVNVASNTALALSSSSPTLGFYSDAG